jgi:hypothetical protein
MGPKGEAIFFEVRDKTGYYTWRAGRAECDPGEGVITVYDVQGKSPVLTVPISQIAGFEITMREGISLLTHIAFGLLLADSDSGYGCLLSLILAPVAAIERLVTKRTRFPVIQLTQSAGDPAEQEWGLWIRSRMRGHHGRVKTREFANHLADVLRESGYSGRMPDLSGDELWFRTGCSRVLL